MLLIGQWKGRGKRIKRSMFDRKFSLYGMRWNLRDRKVLTDDFIKEAGLDQEGIYDAVVENLKTDYGLYVTYKGERSFKTKIKSKAKSKAKIATSSSSK